MICEHAAQIVIVSFLGKAGDMVLPEGCAEDVDINDSDGERGGAAAGVNGSE